MSITPTGSPAWVRNVSHVDYGGNTEKRNYQTQGVVNPRTDIGADDYVRLCSDLASCVRTVPFAVITYLQDDTGTSDPTVEYVRMMTQVYSSSYDGGNPPTGLPTATRGSDGVVTITFASSYNDEYGVAGAFAPQQAEASVNGATFGATTCVVSGQTVTVRTWDDAAAAELDRRVTVEVW